MKISLLHQPINTNKSPLGVDMQNAMTKLHSLDLEGMGLLLNIKIAKTAIFQANNLINNNQ